MLVDLRSIEVLFGPIVIDFLVWTDHMLSFALNLPQYAVFMNLKNHNPIMIQ